MSIDKPFRQDDPGTTPVQPREHQESEQLSDLPPARVEKDEQVKGGRYDAPEAEI